MTERATAFVEEWIAEHVKPEDYAPGDNAHATALAQECLRDAEADGISKAEIDETFDDLAAFIAGELEEAHEREEHDLDDEKDEADDEN